MIIPPPADLANPGPARERAMAQLEQSINAELAVVFESNRARGREHLARILIDRVDGIVDELDAAGHSFGRVDYGGDINYENSEQTWGNGAVMGAGVILEFLGFSCKVRWVDESELGPGKDWSG